MPNYTNRHINSLISNGRWLIEPEFGKAALGKYLQELSLLNTGAVTVKELYGKRGSNSAFLDEDEDKKEPKYYEDYSIEPAVTSRGKLNNASKPTVIRVIRFSGVMMKEGGLSTLGMNTLCELLDNAYRDSEVSGIVLKMDTGGGGVQAAEMLDLKVEQCNKPLVVAATNIYSGGAWATAKADHIVGIGKTAGFGSIGVMSEIGDNTKAREERGYKTHRFYATKSTDKNKGYEEAIKGNYEYYITTQLDPLCEMFIEQMVAGRPVDIENTAWQSGKTFMTQEAIELGLCDSQGTLEDAISICKSLVEKQKAAQPKTYSTQYTMEEKITDLHEAFGGVISANVETGENANKLQTEANKKMVVAYGAAVAAAQMKDRDIEALQQQVTQLTTANKNLQQAVKDKTTALEKVQATSNHIAQTEYDKVIAERDKATADLKAQIAHTNRLIKDNKLNVETTKEQEQEQQVEDTMEEDEKPLTKEQAAYERIKQLDYKGNISMGEVPKGNK